MIGINQTSTSGSFIFGKVNTYADLPPAVDSFEAIFAVTTATGTFLINRKPAGLYRSDGTTWSRLGNIPAFFNDGNLEFYNAADNTKKLKFSLALIAGSTTRVITWPDKDGTPAMLDDVIFGSELNDVENTNSVLTFSINLEDYLNMPLANLPNGKYKLDWFYFWSHDSVAGDFISEIQLDGTNIYPDRHNQQPANSGGIGTGGTDQRHSASGNKILSLNGNHDIDIKFATSSTNSESTIHYGCLILHRIA